MSVYVECICGKRYEIDRDQVDAFDCEGCRRKISVPSPKLEAVLNRLRDRMKNGGAPGMKDAMAQAARMQNFHAVPLLKVGAESGLREAVNTSLAGLAAYPGPGRDVLVGWLREGALGPSRLVTAMREEKYEGGHDLVCELIEKGVLRENQIAEVATYLSESDSHRALEVLRAARRKYPHLGRLLDDAMGHMKHLDESAGEIPDEAKRIPGRQGSTRSSARAEEAPAKKGCMGMLLVVLVALGIMAGMITSLSGAL